MNLSILASHFFLFFLDFTAISDCFIVTVDYHHGCIVRRDPYHHNDGIISLIPTGGKQKARTRIRNKNGATSFFSSCSPWSISSSPSFIACSSSSSSSSSSTRQRQQRQRRHTYSTIVKSYSKSSLLAATSSSSQPKKSSRIVDSRSVGVGGHKNISNSFEEQQSQQEQLNGNSKNNRDTKERIGIIKESDLKLDGPIIGNGTFGVVQWGHLLPCSNHGDDDCDSSSDEQESQSVVTKEAKYDIPRSMSYIRTESYINRRLWLSTTTTTKANSKKLNQNNHIIEHHPNIAPYLGECYMVDNSTTSSTAGDHNDDITAVITNVGRHHRRRMLLVWKESGDKTLEEYLLGPYKTMEELGNLLKMPLPIPHQQQTEQQQGEFKKNYWHQYHNISREILRQLLLGISYCHSKGIVHRDVKPANILVSPLNIDNNNADTSTSGVLLQLIDFGSSADMIASKSGQRIGYRGSGKGPRSLLYCPPEEFVNVEHPYAFDMYTIAMTWLRIVIPGLSYPTTNDSSSNNNGDDENNNINNGEYIFYSFRKSLCDCNHNLSEWHKKYYLKLSDNNDVDDGDGSNINNRNGDDILSCILSSLEDSDTNIQYPTTAAAAVAAVEGTPPTTNNATMTQKQQQQLKLQLPPIGWKEFFYDSREGRDALKLLIDLIEYKPKDRISSASYVLRKYTYVNPTCSEPKQPKPMLRNPWFFSSFINMKEWIMNHKNNVDNENDDDIDDTCEIPDWFFDY